MIVDTNALTAAADDDPAVIAILTRARQMAIPAIVLGEFRYGIAQSRHCAAYEITLDLRHKGKPIPTNDLWIAALCRQHSLPLLSRDPRFDQVKGLKRIGW